MAAVLYATGYSVIVRRAGDMKAVTGISIETSGRKGSVALGVGEQIIAERTFPTDREHARELLPTLEGLCREYNRPPDTIEHCYLSIGPGSFTGLRVAVAFARHFALAVGAKLCAVPTLDVIAENARDADDVPADLAVLLDAKRGQVFAAVFKLDARGYRRVVEPRMIAPAQLLAEAPRGVAVVGEGIAYHRQAVEDGGARPLDSALWWPRAASVYRLGRQIAAEGAFTDPQELLPLYLRRPEAEEVWEKRHGIDRPT